MKKNLCDLNHSSSIIIISYRNMNLQYKFENFLSNIKYFFTMDCNFRKISKNRSSFAIFKEQQHQHFQNFFTHSPSLRRYTFLSHLTTKSEISVRWIKKLVAATCCVCNFIQFIIIQKTKLPIKKFFTPKCFTIKFVRKRDGSVMLHIKWTV